jgi:hypothetical protein
VANKATYFGSFALCISMGAFSAQGALLHVVLDTTPLIGNPAQPFYIEFQLNDGSGNNDGNNTATIDNFEYGGGGPGLMISNTGGSSGSLDTGVTITDSGFFNQFFQEFSPGNTLSFDVNLTEFVDAGPQPDEFTFAILDCSQTEIPTTSPANALVSVDITSPLTINSFSGNPSGSLACNGSPGIPLSTPAVVVVPEPAAASLLLLGFIILRPIRNRRRPVGRHRAP